jgi:hypothetical protein
VLLVLGGGLLATASVLDLGTAEGPGYREALAAGDTFEGGAFLVAGLAFLVAGLVVWGPRVDRHSRLAGLGSALGAGGTLWLAVSAALAVGREGGRLGEAFEVGLASGLYLALAGSVLALLGGVLGLVGGRERPARPAPGFEAGDPRDPWARPVEPSGPAEPRVPEDGTRWAWVEPDERPEPPERPAEPPPDTRGGTLDHPEEEDRGAGPPQDGPGQASGTEGPTVG